MDVMKNTLQKDTVENIIVNRLEKENVRCMDVVGSSLQRDFVMDITRNNEKKDVLKKIVQDHIILKDFVRLIMTVKKLRLILNTRKNEMKLEKDGVFDILIIILIIGSNSEQKQL